MNKELDDINSRIPTIIPEYIKNEEDRDFLKMETRCIIHHLEKYDQDDLTIIFLKDNLYKIQDTIKLIDDKKIV